MANHKGGRKPARRHSTGGGYDLRYFAAKHGISRQQARELIGRIGHNRAALNAAAERLRKPTRPTKRRLRSHAR